jgi:hypothetical protein
MLRLHPALIALMIVIWQEAYTQTESTGFYIVLDKKNECTNSFSSFTPGKPLCLSKRPIISQIDFISVSEIQIDSFLRAKYISLKISKEADARLRLLSKKLPNTALALVIDGTIIGVVENLPSVHNPIPIYGSMYSADIERIHDKIKKLKFQGSP